jgi:Protein of unknown function (DUF3574)
MATCAKPSGASKPLMFTLLDAAARTGRFIRSDGVKLAANCTPSAAALVLTLLWGCAAVRETSSDRSIPSPAKACLLNAEQPMLVAQLFFGQAIRGRARLSDAEWAEFVARTITPNFPDGFTIFDGTGQWGNPRTGQIAREATKILLVATKEISYVVPRLSAVIDAYKAEFRQQSVGVITYKACAAF